jgi:hypothetical protein
VSFGILGSVLGPSLAIDPSPEFLRATAGVGASLFLAYVIEATWLMKGLGFTDESEVRLGVYTGLALDGFLGVVSLLVLSEISVGDDPAGQLLLWWAGGSLFALGFLVAGQPLIAFHREHNGDPDEFP